MSKDVARTFIKEIVLLSITLDEYQTLAGWTGRILVLGSPIWTSDVVCKTKEEAHQQAWNHLMEGVTELFDFPESQQAD